MSKTSSISLITLFVYKDLSKNITFNYKPTIKNSNILKINKKMTKIILDCQKNYKNHLSDYIKKMHLVYPHFGVKVEQRKKYIHYLRVISYLVA